MTETPEPVEAPATSELPAAVAEVLSRVTPRTSEEIREWQFRFDIAPKLKSLGFEERFRFDLRKWNNAKQQQAFQTCEKTLCSVGAIVAMVGIRGTGKTTIAAQLAISRLRAWQAFYGIPEDERNGMPNPRGMAYYFKATDIVGRFKPLYADYGSIETESLMNARDYQCREWSLLVVDELHETEDQKMRDRILADFIDRRYAARTDTLIISNQSPEDFQAKTNPSVLSRLSEHGCIIECNWRSWREREPQKKQHDYVS